MSLFKRDQEQVVCVVLCLPRIDEPILKRVPNGFSVEPGGKVTIKANVIISELFKIRQDRLDGWKNKASHVFNLLFPVHRDSTTEQLVYEELKSAGEAAGSVAQQLLDKGFSLERVRKINYYTLANQELRVYLVIAGNLSDPPAQAVIGRLG